MPTPPPELAALPYLTNDLPGIGGVIKARYEDFQVEEIPAYDPAGYGTHTLFEVEKAGLTTLQAVRDIAHLLGVAPHDIGYAGLKDSRALTRQWMSVEHIDPQRVAEIATPKIKVLRAGLHANKIKIGHLAGNRFTLRVREFRVQAETLLPPILEALQRRGVPNYFGPQRFGARGDTHHIGSAMLRGNIPEALDYYLGRPGPRDQGFFVNARQAYAAGNYTAALAAWPFTYRDERRALRLLADGRTPQRAWGALPGALKRLFLSAYQSHLFNRVAAVRLAEGTLDEILVGDLAAKHDTGAVFAVTDAAAEAQRAQRLEISPTGPVFGYRMSRPTGRPGEIEDSVLAQESVGFDAFTEIERHKLKGVRRPLRFRVHQLTHKFATDMQGPYCELSFTLTKGCYATGLLRELLKNEFAETATAEQEAPDGEGSAPPTEGSRAPGDGPPRRSARPGGGGPPRPGGSSRR